MNTYKTDYDSLVKWINSGKNKSTRKIANNTIVRKAEDSVIVQFHYTDILIITKNSIQMFTGGFYTFTTKDRINSFLPSPFRLFQERKVWYLWNYQTQDKIVFKDGMTISLSDNSVIGAKSKAEVDKSKLIKKSIDNYVKAYISKLSKGEMESPSASDCFYCYMRENKTNKPLGDVMTDNDHLSMHIEEEYYVPSMLYNAIEVYPVSKVATWYIGEMWGDEKTGVIENFGDIAIEQLTKSLRKYLYSHFDIPV